MFPRRARRPIVQGSLTGFPSSMRRQLRAHTLDERNRRANDRLDAAMNNMPEGIGPVPLFDGADRHIDRVFHRDGFLWRRLPPRRGCAMLPVVGNGAARETWPSRPAAMPRNRNDSEVLNAANRRSRSALSFRVAFRMAGGRRPAMDLLCRLGVGDEGRLDHRAFPRNAEPREARSGTEGPPRARGPFPHRRSMPGAF